MPPRTPLLDPRRAARLALSVAKAAAFFHVLAHYGYSASALGGASMLPTFEVAGQWVLISSRHRHGRGVQVGDLVTYDIPVSRDESGLKRVLGMPGDYVVLHGPGSAPSGKDQMIQVPQGHCWLVGDNLTASRDSRAFGPVPLALIRGKAIAMAPPWKWIESGLRKVN